MVNVDGHAYEHGREQREDISLHKHYYAFQAEIPTARGSKSLADSNPGNCGPGHFGE